MGARTTTPASLDLPLDLPLDPNDDPEPRAVWQTVFAKTHPGVTFQQAMTDPILNHGITQVSLKRSRDLVKGIPHKGNA